MVEETFSVLSHTTTILVVFGANRYGPFWNFAPLSAAKEAGTIPVTITIDSMTEHSRCNTFLIIFLFLLSFVMKYPLFSYSSSV